MLDDAGAGFVGTRSGVSIQVRGCSVPRGRCIFMFVFMFIFIFILIYPGSDPNSDIDS